MAGQPKIEITPEVLKEAERLAGQGLTKKQIARCLGMGYSTLMAKQVQHIEFLEAIKTGQAAGIDKVSNALFERAMGCKVIEERFVTKDGEPEVITATKHYPPDTVSCIFYLKNRAPDEWKDRREVATEDLDKKKLVEMTDEELEIHRREIMGEPASPTTH